MSTDTDTDTDIDTDSNRTHPIPPAFQEYDTQQLQQSPAFSHGKHGIADLVVGREGDNPTRLLSDFTRVPYHLSGTLDSDPVDELITICLQDPTGAITQGDRHSLTVTARPDAHAHITDQSASKVQTMKASYAHLEATLIAESGAYLEYLPKPTILNEDARCLQTTTVEMASDATVIVGDVFVPDGLSAHEPFSFDHYQSRVNARVEENLMCADAVNLRPDQRDPRDLATIGEYTVIGTLYVFAPSADTATITEMIHGRLTDHEVAAGVSPLRNEAGVTVRVLGDRSADVTTAIEAAWNETRQELLDVGAPFGDRR